MTDEADDEEFCLEPFVHQVGGHFPMICLDEEIVCKPLNDREHKFYTTLPTQLKPFTPNFEGTMSVETAEDKDTGYITLRGKPPPWYRQCESPLAGHNHHHFRLKREKSLEIAVVTHHQSSAPPSTACTPPLPTQNPLSTSMPPQTVEHGEDSRKNSNCSSISPSSSFYNPWALKCHRDHLKKLGIYNEDKPGKSNRKNPQTYLLLENLVGRYRHPCILDLKLGRRQYADECSAAKKQRKMAKAANSTLASLSLRLGGMQVYNTALGNYTCRNKYYGRALNQTSFKSTIAEFLCNEDDIIRMDVLEKLLEKLPELKTTLEKLDSFRFYTSSLLVTYDGTKRTESSQSSSSEDISCTLREEEDENEDEISEIELDGLSGNNGNDDIVDVRIIDFAHSTHKGLKDSVLHSGPDEGFIDGLTNFISILEDIGQGKIKPGYVEDNDEEEEALASQPDEDD